MKGGNVSPPLKSGWSGFKVSMHRALGISESNTCAHEDETGRCPCPTTESSEAAAGVKSNDICGREGCVNWTDSCEEVGLKPFWKFLCSLRPRVDRPLEEVEATSRQRNILCQREYSIHSG